MAFTLTGRVRFIAPLATSVLLVSCGRNSAIPYGMKQNGGSAGNDEETVTVASPGGVPTTPSEIKAAAPGGDSRGEAMDASPAAKNESEGNPEAPMGSPDGSPPGYPGGQNPWAGLGGGYVWDWSRLPGAKPTPASTPAPGTASGTGTTYATVSSLFAARCTGCHAFTASAAAIKAHGAARVRARIEDNTMPPGVAGFKDSADGKALTSYLLNGTDLK